MTSNADISAKFRAMADRIDRNEGEFGGAFLVVEQHAVEVGVELADQLGGKVVRFRRPVGAVEGFIIHENQAVLIL